MGFLIEYGARTLESASKYDSFATEEECTVIDRTFEDCDCNRYGESCKGKEYEYSVVSSKCGDQTLVSEYNSCQDSNTSPIDIGETATCWVVECDEGRFVWNIDSEITADGLVETIIGCVILVCVCIAGPGVYHCHYGLSTIPTLCKARD